MTSRRWWTKDHLSLVETLVAALNRARTASDAVGEVNELFQALNPLWNENAIVAAQARPELVRDGWVYRDANAFTQLLADQMSEGDNAELCRSVALRRLVEVRPYLENEFTKLQQRQRLIERVEFTRTDERYEHLRLEKALGAYERGPSAPRARDVVKRLARFLYVLRSNIAHGHKTPKGPNIEGERRDRRICDLALPVLECLLASILDHPERRLAAYGTLRRGGRNERVLLTYPGAWVAQGLVRGQLSESDDGFFYLHLDRVGDVEVDVYESATLARDWDAIDAFEGQDYERVLTAVRSSGSVMTAYIYQAATAE